MSFFGCAVLLMIPAEKLLCHVSPYIGALLSLALFLLTENISYGSFRVFGHVICKLPKALYSSNLGIPFGFIPKGFFSSDYYPLFPWSRDDGNWSGWQFITDDGRGYCQCFRRNGAPETVSVSLHGLDANTVYRITDEAGNTAEYSGAQLLGEGLPVTLAEAPTAIVCFIEPIK